MKAERRHALQTNTLATKIIALPNFWKKYGKHIIIGVAAILIITALVVYRISASRAHAARIRDDMSAARMDLNDIRQGTKSPAESAGNIEARLNEVLDSVNDPQTRADALVMLGDLYWLWGNYPDAANAQQNIRKARDIYTKVVTDFADQVNAVAAARFGLAAIAENETFGSPDPMQQWADAKAQYQAIQQLPGLAEVFKAQAKHREELVGKMRVRPLFGELPTTEPTAFNLPSTQTTAVEGPTTNGAFVRAPATRSTSGPAAGIVMPPVTPATTKAAAPVGTPTTAPSVVTPASTKASAAPAAPAPAASRPTTTH